MPPAAADIILRKLGGGLVVLVCRCIGDIGGGVYYAFLSGPPRFTWTVPEAELPVLNCPVVTTAANWIFRREDVLVSICATLQAEDLENVHVQSSLHRFRLRKGRAGRSVARI